MKIKTLVSLSRQTWFVLVGLVFLLVFAWVAFNSGPFAPIKVTLIKVVKGEVAPALFGIGTIEARRAYFIGPTASGRVKKVSVDVGEPVKEGQLLAEMDPVDLDKRVASAFAASARGNSAVATAQAQLKDARSRQSFAAAEVMRFLDLAKRNFVSQSVVDGKLQQQQSGDAQLAAAESSLASAQQDLRRLEAEREAAQQLRGSIRLLAPVDGIVTSRDAEPGSTVIAGQSVLKMQEPGSLWIKVRLDQARSTGLQAGLPADIIVRSDPDRVLAGKLVRIEPISDSVTEERIAQVAFDTIPHGVSTNEMADVTLHLPRVTDALIVPNASLRNRGTKLGVWLFRDGHLRFTPVKIGAAGLDGQMQIVEGLNADDEIVVYSERDLFDESRIKIVDSLAGNAK